MIQHMTLKDGTHLNSHREIHKEAVEYLQTTLHIKGVHQIDTWKDLFQTIITDEDNDSLCHSPLIEEVNTTLFDILEDSSPSPDGFGVCFFMHCQDIIKEDLVEAAGDFFNGTPLPKFYSSNFIVIILKEDNPLSFAKFRPISLCTVVYKVFSKIMVSGLNPLLSKIVSKKQGACISACNIHDNITIA